METGINKIIDMFISGAENFPISECTIQSENEPNVFYGSQPYMVAIIDKQHTRELTIKYMFPYICVDKDDLSFLPDSTGFGWTNMDKRDFCDNIDCSIHGTCWDEYVVGFLPVEMPKSISPDIIKRIGGEEKYNSK